MAIVYVPAVIYGGSGGPDKASVPVWVDGHQGNNSGAYITNGTPVSVPDTNQLTATERKSWVSYKDNKVWYIRIKGTTERWVEYSHVKLTVAPLPPLVVGHYHEVTILGVTFKTTGVK
jgi:hypothetical protein